MTPRAAAVSDVRALLLTDVVDSTALAARIGDDRMAQVWVAHDRVARDLLQVHGGREIDKTDGMLMLFDAAASALAFTRAYHHRLAALEVPLAARAGLHVGAVILRENTAADIALGAKPVEVDGLAKPTTARIMAIARGGQTLLSAEARDALLGMGLAIHSHGHWMIKGVTEPIELFEATSPGDEGTAAPMQPPEDSDKAYRVVQTAEWWLPVRDIPHNLPHQSTSFIGREADVGAARALLASTRLLTLLGMGGLGKTRLALRVAAEEIHRYPDGVWFLDLSPLRDSALVAAEAAQVMGVQAEPGRAMLQSVCAHLKNRRALIVLDNCEHLLQASAAFASAVLKAAPFVRIVASSREALHVPGEQALPLRPLPLPARDSTVTALLQSPAVQLFVERAQQHRPSFSLDAAQAPAVAELVLRLEGIPLALELAAARVRVLPVADINARLKDRYRVLTGGGSVLQARQQTLRGLVDWSYELLSADEQTLFRRLGVFIGGFDLAAAGAVCGFEPLDDDVLDLLSSLVEKSLVQFLETDDGGRYRMLETLRDYAREKLAGSGEEATTAARHCEQFFTLTKQARNGMRGAAQAEWIQRLETDLDNVRAAFTHALGGAVDPLIAMKMCNALLSFWTLRGYTSEGMVLTRAALALPAVQADAQAHAFGLYAAAALAEAQSDHAEARRLLEECLALRRPRGNAVEIAATLSTLSLARLQAGDPDAAAASEQEALQLFRDLGERAGEAIGLLHLAQIAAWQGDAAKAQPYLDQSLAIARELRHQEIEGECELLAAELAYRADDRQQAQLWCRRALSLCREAADRRGEANALRWLARCEMADDRASAQARLALALPAFRSFEMWDALVAGLEDCAELAERDGDTLLAARLLFATTRARQRMQLPPPPLERERLALLAARLQQALGVADLATACGDAPAWDIEEALRNALRGTDTQPAATVLDGRA